MRLREWLQHDRLLSSSLRLSLGGLELAIGAEQDLLPPEAEAYRAFCAPAPIAGPEAVPVRIVVTKAPAARGRVIFESQAHWSILADGSRRAFVDRDASGPILAVHFEPGGGEVLVECAPAWLSPGPRRAIRSPVCYPVDQILAMYLLGCRGILVHAAGVLVHGRAVVLPGVSGAGKTTFARLAAGRAGWEHLSDDRIIVRLPDDASGAIAHGTPWPGEGRIASNQSGPLARLLFLDQGTTDALRPLTPAQAASRLVATASIPWFDSEYVGATLDACDRLVSRVPATLLTFRPGEAVLALVERVLEEDRNARR